MSGRRAKLVCTVGPATSTLEGVRGLAEAGAQIFRVNLSHGDAALRAALVELVRTVSEERGEDLAILADLPGPKIRLGSLEGGEASLAAGARFELRTGNGLGDSAGASTTYPGLAGDLRPGDRILHSDGAVELTVASIEGPT
ncbi:MAG: pyruvate kinase, partial [Actinomycetota bacterium]